MNEIARGRLDPIAQERLRAAWPQNSDSLRQIAAGNPLGAEPDMERMVERMAFKTGLAERQAETISIGIQESAKRINRADAGPIPPRFAVPLQESRPEAVWDGADFLGVEFFTRGRIAANAVGRILFRSGRVQGTGFLVGPSLLLTNNHVIETPSLASSLCVQFDFELDDVGINRAVTVFEFDSDACFAFAPIEGLDFTLIAVGPSMTGDRDLSAFGYLPLSDAGDKHVLGEVANIIQHPEGRLKQIVLRNNSLVARDETSDVLHYIADTQQGSSGSPVLNNEWEPIALHHWAGAHLETRSATGQPLRIDVNEGIRISRIVQALRRGDGVRGAQTREAIGRVLEMWDSSKREGPVTPAECVRRESTGSAGSSRSNVDGLSRGRFQ